MPLRNKANVVFKDMYLHKGYKKSIINTPGKKIDKVAIIVVKDLRLKL
jgi:hypothetical protein